MCTWKSRHTSWSLSLVSVTVFDRNGSSERTSTNRSEDSHLSNSQDVDMSWLLQVLSSEVNGAEFAIDRSDVHCITPTNNKDTDSPKNFFRNLGDFFSAIETEMCKWEDMQPNFPQVRISEVKFSPLLTLFETRTNSDDAQPCQVSLSSSTVTAMVEEYRRELAELCAGIVAALPASSTEEPVAALFTVNELVLATVAYEIAALQSDYFDAVTDVDEMVRAQLVAAIGKSITPADFAQYMTFHNRKVFKEAFQPKPFSYAVRRSPLHSPEGQIQIETTQAIPAEPIYTVSQHVEDAPLMEFALNATTMVQFGGERHLHGWMAHRFSGQALPKLKLVTEARQFSSYIVLIGRIASAKLFQPKYGFIVQNKDEFRIPLELEQIPTAKEFKDAISSLSPEQQRFAKVFRSMQLESTPFGVCVIQIKPQLEKVLKLQADSLTKEIKLTQDLMQLFIKYQIPSDLLSFDDSVQGASSVHAADRLLAVKRHVQVMQEMLACAKDEEVAAKHQEREFLYGIPAPSASSHSEYEDDCEEECDEGGGFDFYESCAAPPPPPKAAKKSGFLGSLMRRSSASSAPPPPPAPSAAPMMMKSCVAPSVSMACVAAPSGGAPPAPQPSIPVPTPTPTSTSKPESTSSLHESNPDRSIHSDLDPQAELVDYTQYPNKLEEMYTRFDPDASLRPTIINPGATWTKRAQAGLLSTPQTTSLGADSQATEKSAAFDLLDALTRSGALAIEHASLHVIIAATHCFDQSLMDTVVQRNVNPIERVERSTLIMAATLNDLPAAALITESQVERVATFSPMLFELAVEE